MNKTANILVVDDNLELLELTALLLTEAGYNVFSASTGQEGWDMCQSKRPDLVLMDVQLPDMDGRDVCRKIKSDPLLDKIFVVIISGAMKTSADHISALEAGADGYLNRPISNRELLAHIGAMIRIRLREIAQEQKDVELEVARQVAFSMMQDADLQRQKAEDAWKKLEQSTQSLRTLFRAIDNIPASVAITDSRGVIEYVNPRFSEVTGFSAEEAIGGTPHILSSGLHDVAFYKEMWEIILAGRTWRGEVCNKTKSGQLFWESSSISSVRNEQGQITHFVAIKEDITAQKQVAEALRQAKEAADAANRAKSMFLANMSHEIRTPLSAILGFSQLMRRDTALTPQQRQHLETINTSGEHLLALINDVLEMSKIEAGRILLNPVSFDLHALLNDLELLFRLRTDAKGLQFSIERIGQVPRFVVADEGKLRQVLMNLLGNAVKFTNAGSISVRVRRVDDPSSKPRLQCEVVDTGMGISDEEKGRLFQHFEQTLSGRNSGTGTGLGLAISREFVRLMGGDITVESQVAHGSVFQFTISLEDAKEQDGSLYVKPSAARRVLHLLSGQPPCRVLVADDNETTRMLLIQMLSAAGFQCREAVNGGQALDFLASWQPHLILMDKRMPVMDGEEATRRIRSDASNRAIKIILLTASAFDEDRGRALAAGADDFLSKPFRDSQLFEKIGHLLSVQFEYSIQAEPSSSETSRPGSDAVRDSLAKLSPTLNSAMQEAIRNGDMDRLHQHLGELELSDASLALSLRRLADQYEYDALSHLLSSNTNQT